MALLMGYLDINPISTFNPISNKGEQECLIISLKSYVSSFRVMAFITGNLKIAPISTFNPISTNYLSFRLSKKKHKTQKNTKQVQNSVRGAFIPLSLVYKQ